MNTEVLVFSHSSSPRLQYIIDLLSQYYGLSFGLVYDEERYLNATSPLKINYGYHRITAGEIFIHSHVLLFETNTRPVRIECFQHNHYKAFFRAEGDLGFDLFAAIFYLVSRYEEYLPHKKDNYGRYAHENSLAFKEGFLDIPLVDTWLEDFRVLMGARNGIFLKSKRRFRFLPTYDIDMAWVYRNKGFKRNAGSILLLLLQFRFRQALYRYDVMRKKKPDPYDAYEWMDHLHKKFKLEPLYFLLVAGEQGKFDRNIDTKNKEFRELVQQIASKYEIGLHPSWQSGDHFQLVKNEKKLLEEISGKPVLHSRQHYIRFDLPHSFQNLVACGIGHDHSMGYGSINGFRASISTPFYWYDLKNETATGLLLHPFCFMDANSYYEQGFTPEQALEQMMQYYETIKSVNGTMITIWHNSFLGTSTEFEGWKEAYLRFVQAIHQAA